ncbi:caspase domain-containing protein [Sneathiella sp.]|uniref:caspase family protein n=1 Tax=Sneathiella sp. TaxID=1964365 RepID=UPI0035627F94
MGKKALLVGINDYPNAELPCCVNDTLQLAAHLKTHVDGSPNFAVQTMVSPSQCIGRADLRRNIDELFKGDPEIALFYFSGHGYINSLGGYVVTSDFTQYDEGVSMDEILKLANQSQAKNKIIILDCCHAGAFGTPDLTGSNMAQLSEGLSILTACRSSEAAIAGQDLSVFTSLIIEALQGGAADLGGHVTPGGIYAFVDKALGEWGQRPIFKTNVSSFASIRRTEPPVSLETLRKIVDYFPEPQDEHKLSPAYEFTNDPENPPPEIKEPYADPEKVEIMKDLQKLASVGLVRPVGEDHMYFAAMNSKTCQLTALGNHYWQLVKGGEHI